MKFSRFEGLIPKVKPIDLPEYAAEQAQNVYSAEGKLSPLKGLSASVATIAVANAQTIYKYSTIYLAWQKVVNVCPSPIVSDSWSRVYWSGDGAPKFGDSALLTASAPYPSGSLTLGIPMPATAPVVALGAASGNNTDYADDETRFYVVTHVNKFGEEGPPSAVSARLVLVEPGQPVTLTLPVLASNNFAIDRQRVYRSASGASSSGFFLVAELPIAQRSLTDTLLSDGLGPELITQDYDPPPADLKGLTLMANGILAGFVGNTLHFSESYLAYAWPKRYRLTTSHPIVAIGATTNALVVATEGFPYIVSGVSPSAMSSERLESNHACVSARSMVDMGEFVIYASPDGLVGVSSNQVILLTEDVISARQWREMYNPATIIAACYNGKYLAFFTSATNVKQGFIFDPDTKSLMPLSVYYPAVYNDLATGAAFVLNGTQICGFDQGAAPLQMSWRSKPFMFGGNELPNAISITGSQLSALSFSLWIDGVKKHTISDCSRAADSMRLPPLRGRTVQFEFAGTGTVEMLAISDDMADLV
jgi:hypothetical protein